MKIPNFLYYLAGFLVAVFLFLKASRERNDLLLAFSMILGFVFFVLTAHDIQELTRRGKK